MFFLIIFLQLTFVNTQIHENIWVDWEDLPNHNCFRPLHYEDPILCLNSTQILAKVISMCACNTMAPIQISTPLATSTTATTKKTIGSSTTAANPFEQEFYAAEEITSSSLKSTATTTAGTTTSTTTTMTTPSPMPIFEKQEIILVALISSLATTGLLGVLCCLWKFFRCCSINCCGCCRKKAKGCCRKEAKKEEGIELEPLSHQPSNALSPLPPSSPIPPIPSYYGESAVYAETVYSTVP